MYKHRIESNSQHINSLNDGANVMKEHIIKITDDVQIVREKIDSLDTNRKVAKGRNYDLRNKYITLLKKAKSNTDRQNTIYNESQVKPVFVLVKEASICSVCIDNLGKDIYCCTECIGILCKFCAEKVIKCPFCGF